MVKCPGVSGWKANARPSGWTGVWLQLELIDALGIQGITQEAQCNPVLFFWFQYVIRDKGLLMKSLLVIGAVVVLFFVQSFVDSIHLDIGLFTICYIFYSF